MIDSFLRKEDVCTLTKTDGLAETDRKVCKTEKQHNLCNSSAEAGGKDNEVGSQESPECTKIHEKPSTSVVKVVNKGEGINFFCSAHFPKSVAAAGCVKVPSVYGMHLVSALS